MEQNSMNSPLIAGVTEQLKKTLDDLHVTPHGFVISKLADAPHGLDMTDADDVS